MVLTTSIYWALVELDRQCGASRCPFSLCGWSGTLPYIGDRSWGVSFPTHDEQ